MPDNIQQESRETIKFAAGDLGVISTDETTTSSIEDFLSGGDSSPKPVEKSKKPLPSKEPSKIIQKEQEKEEEQIISSEELADQFLNEDEENKETNELEEEESETKNDEDDDKLEENTNSFSDLAADLFDMGVFTLGENERNEDIKISTPEDLRQRFDFEKKRGAGEALDAFIGRFGQAYQDMFESVFVKGVDPVEYLQHFAVAQEVQNLDITTEENQEKVVRELLRREGRSVDQINKRIDRLKGYGDLEEEAKEAISILIKKEEQELSEKENRKIEEKQRKTLERQSYHQSVNKVLTEKLQKKEFDGIPVDRKFAEEIGAYITKEKYKVGEELLTEFDKELLDLKQPGNTELKIKVAMLLKMIKTDPTLSKIQKKAISNETNTLFRHLQNKKVKTNNTVTKKEEESSRRWFS